MARLAAINPDLGIATNQPSHSWRRSVIGSPRDLAKDLAFSSRERARDPTGAVSAQSAFRNKRSADFIRHLQKLDRLGLDSQSRPNGPYGPGAASRSRFAAGSGSSDTVANWRWAARPPRLAVQIRTERYTGPRTLQLAARDLSDEFALGSIPADEISRRNHGEEKAAICKDRLPRHV